MTGGGRVCICGGAEAQHYTTVGYDLRCSHQGIEGLEDPEPGLPIRFLCRCNAFTNEAKEIVKDVTTAEYDAIGPPTWSDVQDGESRVTIAVSILRSRYEKRRGPRETGEAHGGDQSVDDRLSGPSNCAAMMNGCESPWSSDIAKRIDDVYAANRHLVDHRTRFPWLTGFLGDPMARVWFVAWYPSTRAVEKVHSPTATCESQWLATEGDRIFRRNLLRCGFKTGNLNSPGGWKCYITDLVKADSSPSDWDRTSPAGRQRVYETWLPVLEWEFRNGQPRLVVAIGDAVDRRLDDIWPALQRAAQRPIERMRVRHYASFNYRDGDSPENRRTYEAQFAGVIQRARQIR